MEADLVGAAETTGLPRADALATIRKALADGARQPRTLPDDLRSGRRARAGNGPAPYIARVRAAREDLAPPEALRPVLVATWEATQEEELPGCAVAYLEGRAIRAEVAADANSPEHVVNIGIEAQVAAWLLREGEGFRVPRMSAETRAEVRTLWEDKHGRAGFDEFEAEFGRGSQEGHKLSAARCR